MKYLLSRLTPRELEVLSCMANGYSNPNIANQLFVQPKTVEHYVNNIYSKFDLVENKFIDRRVQAVLIYIESTEMMRIKKITEDMINEVFIQVISEYVEKKQSEEV